MPTKPEAKSPDAARLGEQFRAVRKRQKITLKDLAAQMNVSVNTIRWHEAGDRMLRTDQISEAARCLGVLARELTEIDETQPHGTAA